MKLYVLRRLDAPDYDEQAGIIVRAASATEARLIAADNAGLEGPEVWKSRDSASVRAIHLRGKAGVVLRDFRHG